MLIPILLFEKGILRSPVFYLSAYLEQHRDIYTDRLQAISEQDDWNGWVRFFLTALVEQARRQHTQNPRIMSLYERHEDRDPRNHPLSVCHSGY